MRIEKKRQDHEWRDEKKVRQEETEWRQEKERN